MAIDRTFFLEKEMKATIVLDALASGYYAITNPGQEPSGYTAVAAGQTYVIDPENAGNNFTLHLDSGNATITFSFDGLNKTKVDALTGEEVAYVNAELGSDTVEEALDELAERCNATKGPDIDADEAGTYTINASNGVYQKITVGANITLAFTFPASQVQGLCLEVVNGGAHTITWPETMRFAGKEEPVLTASGSDLLAIFTDGTNLNCSVTASDIGVPA